MRRLSFARSIRLVVVGLLAVPGLVQAQPAPVDPCELLSAQEVSAALGELVEPGRLTDNGLTRDGAASTTCLWAVPLPSGAAPDPTRPLSGRQFVILNVMNWPGGANGARKFLDDFRTAFLGKAIPSEPVPIDVGADEALWWGDGVAARREGISFGISVASGGDRDLRRPRAEALARLIAGRLPGPR